ncbi:carboxylate-amine ligase [Estrella lausannensis]|uniref:Glutamate-cysteine ligase n=1 Tax=Estrella lausannensis TaxID=483423 RepID=A0A0H5DPF5_9BACT|nr:glutamate-cysteine ligase family protein [Estrella lausannensis]CRX38312.1 Glutamate-cysteine ligase [Estrella lausannensis]
MSSDVMKEYKYSLFKVFGVELEYMMVDRETLDILPAVDTLFKEIAGEITSEIEGDVLSLNNELALHVVELKTTTPVPALSGLSEEFQRKIRELNKLLSAMGGCLMPTAMHPWMDPHKETKLWPHGSSEIYNAFNAIFNCKGHGWGNLQSAHLNLPFKSEEEFVKLHSAIRIVLPLIPLIAASSPYADGHKTGLKDTRLNVYLSNCKRIFSVTGHAIPESCASYEDYERKILGRIYEDLSPFDPEGVLRHEWVNARGAITRFERGSIEIRLVDIQEEPRQDMAILDFLSRLTKFLSDKGRQAIDLFNSFEEERLKGILLRGIQSGEDALIEDREYLSLFGLQRSASGNEIIRHIVDNLIGPSKDYKEAMDILVQEGTLATRLLKNEAKNHAQLKEKYKKLCRCLDRGEPYLP